MASRRFLVPLLVTSSLFLVHCSSGDDDSADKAGTGGGAGKPNTSAGTGGTTSGSAGMTSAAGTGATGGGTATGGSGGATASAGQGGSSGTTGGQGGHAGSMAGNGGHATAGAAGAGAGAAGKGSGGMSGAGGNAGSGASGMGAGGASSGGKSAGGNGGTGGAGAMTLTSSVITEGGMFPDQSTCASTTESSPDLTWTAGPSGTMSYAVILFDTVNSLNHWVLWDIPSSVTTLPAMLDTAAMLAMPAGAKQRAVSGNGYYGPCPSGMDHLYRFTVYALPVATLSGAMTSSQTSALATAVMNANPLASASLSAHSSAKMP